MPAFDQREIGLFIEFVPAVTNLLTAAGTMTSLVVDRAAPGGDGLRLSGALGVFVGAATGTPDSFTVTAKVQHSDASDGSAASDLGYAITTMTAAGVAQINFPLDGAKRYIKAVVVVAFVAGTTPKIPVSAVFALGGGQQIPL